MIKTEFTPGVPEGEPTWCILGPMLESPAARAPRRVAALLAAALAACPGGDRASGRDGRAGGRDALLAYFGP